MWYFWGMARRFNPGDAEVTDRIREGQHKIFSEVSIWPIHLTTIYS
jgi:vanillate O-demethylase monooxygenase subunit